MTDAPTVSRTERQRTVKLTVMVLVPDWLVEVDDAFTVALASPEPDISSLYTDVVAEVTV